MAALHRRSLLPLCLVLAGLTVACADKEADDAATATTDSSAVAAADLQPPADLKAVADEYLASWNADDPAKLATFFAEDAVVHEDTATYTGRAEIQDKWLKPAVAAITALHITEQKWSQSGADYRVDGKAHMEMMMDGKKSEATGSYDETWSKGADGTWKVKAMNTRMDAPPPPPPATTSGL